MSKIPGPDHMWFRWFAGHPLDGHYRTDATFFRAGTKSQHKTPVGRWSYLAGWRRSAVRNLVALGVPALVWQYRQHPSRTVALVAVVAVWAVTWGALRAWKAWGVRQDYRTYVRPIHDVLGPLLGLPPTTRPNDYITVPHSFRENEKTPVHITLPRAFAPSSGNRELITSAVLPKLGVNEDNTDVIFRSVGNPTVDFKMAPQPPDRVMWAASIDLITSCEPGQIFVGLGARNKPYIRDFREGEVVHGGFNGQTGSGKSNAVMGWVAQFLHSDPGTTVTFVDPKQSTLPNCLVGVPGYTLANNPDDPAEMWRVIEVFENEMDRRRNARLKDPTLEFSLMYLILDELSEFADISKEHWDEIKEKGDRKTARIWRSIARIMRMGREFGCRVLVFTQRLDSASTGGFGLRDLLGWRGLSKYKKNHWMMLIGTTPIPKMVNRVGRWIYSDGDKELWVQNVYATEIELREWAVAGRRDVDTHRGQMAPTAVLPAASDPGVQWEVIGLEAAADYLDVPRETFRKRRTKAEGVPGEGLVGRSPAFMKADLDAFWSTSTVGITRA